jgi:hypothetical protein
MLTRARELALRLDPGLLMTHGGLVPDPWQMELLRSRGRDALLLCSRQAGKSTVSAALAIHAALFEAPALVLLLSPSLRQSIELFRKVMAFYRAIGAAAPLAESALRLELTNGSRIVSLPGTPETVRGYSAHLLVVDEAAFTDDALYAAVRPMLAVSHGRLVAMTTPNGQRGWFFREWTEGGEAFLRFRVTAHDCPRIPAVWLERERARIGERGFRQEYECTFLDTDDAAFETELVQAALSSEVAPLFPTRA